MKKATRSTAVKPSDYSPEFLDFYAVYPRHESKLAALKAYLKVTREMEISHATLVSGAQRYADHIKRNGIGLEYTKLPASWLNAGCWDDEYVDRAPRQTANGQANYGDSIERAVGIAYHHLRDKENIRH